MDVADLDPLIETLGREALSQIQLCKLQRMLGPVLRSNAFYRRRLGEAGVTQPEDIRSADDYRRLPFTTKQDLSADQAAHPPYGTNLTFPRDRYIRIHQTSGSTGEPLRCLDTQESWDWWLRCWAAVYRAAGVGSADRVFYAFSFGPFIGFWSAYEGVQRIGALAIPGGGMTSRQRARTIVVNDVSVLVCTPTYALHLAEVADEEGIDIAGSGVRITIHAGEPGASLPATRRRIEQAWGARCHDHAGATEVGAWGFECEAQAGIHVNEGEFIVEIIDPVTARPAEEGELVITNLGRTGMPVIRYRTGDRVRATREVCACGRRFVRFEGGIIGRIDDVLVVRGIAVFPSAVEEVVRRFAEAGEFAVEVHRRQELDEMTVRLEVLGGEPGTVASAVAAELHHALGLRIRVDPIPYGTLPRVDRGARRFTDHRHRHAAVGAAP